MTWVVGLIFCNGFVGIRAVTQEKPEVVIVVVIDQFANFYLKQLAPWLHNGIYDLIKHGVVYTDAHHPNGATVTAVGHTDIGTGTYAKYHGIVDNDWINAGNQKTYSYVQDAHLVLVPTLSKPFLASNKRNKALAISLKGRAAMGMVGNDAPAVWLDEDKFMVHGKKDAEVKRLVAQFNRAHALLKPQAMVWHLAYDDPRYYQQPYVNNYDYASAPSLINVPAQAVDDGVDYFENIAKFPQTNKLILDLALDYLRKVYRPDKHGRILLWLSLSTLDKVGHIYGPYSKEVIDTLYHLDQQLAEFMRAASTIVPKTKTLYVLTGDHGVMPIPELLKARYPQAKRVMTPPILKEFNQAAYKKFGYVGAIVSIEVPFVYLNQELLRTLSSEKQAELTNFLVAKFKKVSGVVEAYDTTQLARLKTKENSPLRMLQNNIYPGRSGQITLLISPYAQVTKHPKGTSHQSPYDFNTHVPLVLYWPGHLAHATVSEHVWVPQLHATLAKILGVAPASRYVLPPLPGVFKHAKGVVKSAGSKAQNDQALASCFQSAIAHA